MDENDDFARTRAVLARRPDLRTLEVTGPDRVSWLQGLVTSDTTKLAPRAGQWSLVLSKPGKILSDVFLVADGERVLVAVPSASADRIRTWFEHHLIMEDAELADVSASHEWALVHGPRAAEVASRVVDSVGGTWAALELTGLGDAVLCVPRERAPVLAASAGADVRFISGEDWERLRIERAVPLYAADMTEEQNPHDVSLERRTVAWDKGCYLGQEAVCMQDMRGKLKRRLVLLSLGAGAPPRPGTAVSDDQGAAVGETRSAALSRVFGGPIALAVVRVEASSEGRKVKVGGVPAEIVAPR